MPIELKVTVDTPAELAQTLAQLGQFVLDDTGAPREQAAAAPVKATRTRKTAAPEEAKVDVAAEGQKAVEAALGNGDGSANQETTQTQASEPAAPAAPATPETATAGAAAEVTFEMVRGKMAELMKSKSAAAVQQVLKKNFGVSGPAQLPKEKYAEAFAAFEAELKA